MADRLRAVLTCDARAELRRVQVPILYVAATKGPLGQRSIPENRSENQAGRKGCKNQRSHLIAQRKPSDTATAVVEFLRQIT